MLAATVSQIVLDVLKMFQDQDRVFTAYDVTAKAREKTTERIDHCDVRDIVHNAWMMGEFPDNFKRIDGLELSTNGNPLVICYYPDCKTAYDHPLALPAKIPVAQTTPMSQPIPSSISSSLASGKIGRSMKNSDGSYTCEPTGEGRIEIPKDLLNQVDKAGDSVDFMVSGNLVCSKPDKEGRVRLSLRKLGFSATDPVTVTISVDAHSIMVSA